MKELKFRKIIETIIGEINESKRKSKTIHSAGNIKSSGDEVENLVREKISLFLPERYLVKQGHIVNSEGLVSNQFDIIIFDRLNTPKFFESQNETVFYPIESVLAVGEIKKTLRKNDLLEFRKKIKFLKLNMKRKLFKNTVFENQLNDSTSMLDIVTMSTDRKFKNPLFSFVFAIDGERIDNIYIDESNKYMPNDVYVLNKGYLIYGEVVNNIFKTKIEDEEPLMDSWIAVEESGVICLSMMFNQLINHLNKCYIEPFSISPYMYDKTDFGVQGSKVKVYSSAKKE